MYGDNFPELNKPEYTPEEIANFAVKYDTFNQIKKLIGIHGLEGAEEVIKRLYRHNEGIRTYMLKMLYEIWKG